jgi:hypothetical protein
MRSLVANDRRDAQASGWNRTRHCHVCLSSTPGTRAVGLAKDGGRKLLGQKDFLGDGQMEPLMNALRTLIKRSQEKTFQQIDAPKSAKATMRLVRMEP